MPSKFVSPLHMLGDIHRDLVLEVTKHLPPRDLLRLMFTCARMLAVGKTAPLWTEFRESSQLAAPRPAATKYKTDFDIITMKACRICFQHRRDAYGFCAACRRHNSALNVHYHSLFRSRLDITGLERRGRLLRRKLATNCRQHEVAQAKLATARASLLERRGRLLCRKLTTNCRQHEAAKAGLATARASLLDIGGIVKQVGG